MKHTLKKHLWFYPILFGLLGAFLGLIIRFFFAYSTFSFPFKNVIHAHSHIMLLGLLFNALAILIWERFTNGIDNISYKIYLALQVCLGVMLVAFIVQGYAFFSILFSALHLWLSYAFVIRLWNRLNGDKTLLRIIKTGVVFHFISSIGPYCLGPLMIFEMNDSPWYTQAVFFYLHFQFFGVLFLWLLALFFKSNKIKLNNKSTIIVCLIIIGLYAHSLDFSFDHWLLNVIGGITSITLTFFILQFSKIIWNQKTSTKVIYTILLIAGIFNVFGSFPLFADLVIENHFMLIAWLHFLFLGLYVPYIWIESPFKVSKSIWILYFISMLISELLLIFPEMAFSIFNISIMKLVFYAYIAVTVCISIIHFRYLFLNNEKHL